MKYQMTTMLVDIEILDISFYPLSLIIEYILINFTDAEVLSNFLWIK